MEQLREQLRAECEQRAELWKHRFKLIDHAVDDIYVEAIAKHSATIARLESELVVLEAKAAAQKRAEAASALNEIYARNKMLEFIVSAL